MMSPRLQLRNALLQLLVLLVKKLEAQKTIEPRLFTASVKSLGMDASPNDQAPDELGCAETVTTIIRSILPTFPIILGTWTLWDILRNDERFEEVTSPLPGDIIISPTGTGNGTIVGHVGIMAVNNEIMSNTSANGKFENNYNLDLWKARYKGLGGLPVYFFRLVV